MLQKVLMDSKVLVHLLVCIFAISSWVDINGMWVELPILVTHLPEKWTLPSYITIISQIANIGPIIFVLISLCLKRTHVKKLTLDKITSYIIMIVGVASTLLLAFFWEETIFVDGADRSFALLALSFFLSFVDCTSSVAYVAFMASLKPVYLSSFFVGEGLSGLLPALMALGQGAGEIKCVNASSTSERNVSGNVVNVTDYYVYPTYLPPRFSVQLFFLLLCGMIFLSMVAFSLLNFWGYCKDQLVAVSMYNLEDSDNLRDSIDLEDEVKDVSFRKTSYSYEMTVSLEDEVGVNNKDFPASQAREKLPNHVENKIVSDDSAEVQHQKTSKFVLFLLLLQIVIINFLITAFLLSIQVYSSLPYGIDTYNLVVTLSNIANPVACIISVFLSITSPWIISLMTTCGLGCSAYIIALACLSPTPPLIGTSSGGPVAVAVWVGASFFLTYAKISVAGVMRQVGRHALIVYGALTQTGALLGAVTGFVLVNEVKVFKDASWC
ncbi:solute carrier family 52, riboflavin transporter, member 3-B-like [Pomacea canaliculata]|uniref:solute carrier family 52, riboflavin transporter, member 3-B-like n=1 Tax=Pomacea canaliculata TaxID=400727 RepID=UPI000D73C4CF|nr:solute carrier family 52, riboflavin transporter, member 3-B-like [Pomacea canaliculata]